MRVAPRFFGPNDPQTSALLSAQEITFGFENQKKLLQHLSVSLPQEGVFRLSGPGGSGVTTLLKILAGLVSPNEGQVLWGNHRIDRHSLSDPWVDHARWRLACGYVARSSGLMANQTLLSNVSLPLVYHGWLGAEEVVVLAQTYLQHLAIEEEATKLPAWSSLPAQKAALFVRALLPQPQILILDEPRHGLNGWIEDRLLSLLQFHRQELGLRLVLFGSQDASWDKALQAKEVHFANGAFEGNTPW